MTQSDQREILYFGVDSISESVIDSLRAANWLVTVARNVKAACEIITEREIHVGLTEMNNIQDETWLPPIEALMQCNLRVEWIALFPDIDVHYRFAHRILGDFFFSYHSLPHDPKSLLFTLDHADQIAQMKWHQKNVWTSSSEIVGNSPAMHRLISDIAKIANVSTPVLITGESGTGKELVAKAIHDNSTFKKGPLVAVNCGAITSTLVQAELFGYEKGAFTGANKRKIGYIESAKGGTIFLDEIGDLPLEQQINLLRFLQEKTIQRVGGNEHIHVDVRVISATHIDLENAVAAGRLREDLYYRLNVLHLKTPPLREREGDIELLAYYFFEQFAEEKRANVRGFSASCIKTMNYYAWKGNVRELINRIRHALVMCDNHLISAADLGIEGNSPYFQWISLKEIKDRAEKEAIQQALERTDGNISVAARHLSISRVMLYRLIDKYQISL